MLPAARQSNSQCSHQPTGSLKKVKVAHTRVKRTGYMGSCYDALGIRHSLPSVILAVRMTHVGLGDVQTQLAFLQKSKLFSQKLH